MSKPPFSATQPPHGGKNAKSPRIDSKSRNSRQADHPGHDRSGEQRQVQDAGSKREQRAEERARRHEQLQKDSLGAIYRRLVKELHPDLESDAAARQHKGAIMQQVTAAYARRDLHALLHLELEWLGATAGAWRGVQDKLTAYTELLKEQAAQLQAELRELRLHPKYAPLLVDDAFGGPMVVDGPAEVERLDAQIAQRGAAIERLSTDQALAEVRGAIREYQATRKRWAMPRLRRQYGGAAPTW